MIKGLSVIAAIVLTGCSHAAKAPTTTHTPTAAGAQNATEASAHDASALHRAIPPAPGDAKYPILVHIVSRDQVITVKSGPHGLLYSITGDQDRILIADATEKQFEQTDPELYRQLRNYMAVEADASVSVE